MTHDLNMVMLYRCSYTKCTPVATVGITPISKRGKTLTLKVLSWGWEPGRSRWRNILQPVVCTTMPNGSVGRKSVGLFFTLGWKLHVIKRLLLGPVIQESLAGDEKWGGVSKDKQTKTKARKLKDKR